MLAGMIVLVLAALLLSGNWPKVIRVGLSSFAYLAILVGVSVVRRSARSGFEPVPLWPFVLAGAVAGFVSGVARVDPTLPVVAVQTAGAGLLLGGPHWLAVRRWRRVDERQ